MTLRELKEIIDGLANDDAEVWVWDAYDDQPEKLENVGMGPDGLYLWNQLASDVAIVPVLRGVTEL